MSFVKASEILRRAAAGEVIEYDLDREMTQSPPPPVQTGNPARLKEAYRALFRVALTFITNPSELNRADLNYKRGYCSSIEPECAPVGSPWFRPPVGADTTIFAKERALEAQLSKLLSLSTSTARWVLLSQQLTESIGDLRT